MTRDECIAIIEGCEFRLFDAKIVVCDGYGYDSMMSPGVAAGSDMGMLSYFLCVKVPSRDDPSIRVDVRSGGCLPYERLSAEQLAQFVFREVCNLMQHEAAEHFYVGGKRVYDPHKSTAT